MLHARVFGFGVLLAVGLVAACTVNSTDSSSGSAADGGTSSSSSSSSSSSGGSNNASTTAAPVTFDAACAAFTPCGGNPSGTYDYTGGCIGDALVDLKAQCPTLDASKMKVEVKGSLFFAGNALTRNATVTVSGSIKVPQSCIAGQCAILQTELTKTGITATCTGSGDCDCTLSKNENASTATTFTVSGNNVTTADGETYSICEKDGTLSYEGKTAQSEDGVWNLKKR